jgi:hypothetical protein
MTKRRRFPVRGDPAALLISAPRLGPWPTQESVMFLDHAAPTCQRTKNVRLTFLTPALLDALSDLAISEDLPLNALITVLINEALDRRLRRCRP